MIQSKLQMVTSKLEFGSVAQVAGSLEMPVGGATEFGASIGGSRDLAKAQEGCLRGIRYALVMQAGGAALISALIYAWSHL